MSTCLDILICNMYIWTYNTVYACIYIYRYTQYLCVCIYIERERERAERLRCVFIFIPQSSSRIPSHMLCAPASKRKRSIGSMPLWESRTPVSRSDFPLWNRRPSAWCLWCPAWSVRQDGRTALAAELSGWTPDSPGGHYWIAWTVCLKPRPTTSLWYP